MSINKKITLIIKNNSFYRFILGQIFLTVIFFSVFYYYKKFQKTTTDNTIITIDSIDFEINKIKKTQHQEIEAEIEALEATKIALKSKDASSIRDKLNLLKQSMKMFETSISKDPNNPLLRIKRLKTLKNVPLFLRENQIIDNDLEVLEHWIKTNNSDKNSENIHDKVCRVLTLWNRNTHICDKNSKIMEHKSVH